MWVILFLPVASLAFPPQAAAQRAPVVRTLVELRAALDGTYGDEGPEVARLIGGLSQTATTWDQLIRASELRLGQAIGA